MSSQVLLDALPKGFVPDDLDLDEVNIEEALSAVSENLGEALGSLGGGEGGIDISQLGSLAGQFGSESSDGAGIDFSQLGGLGSFGSLGSLGSQLAGATGYNLKGKRINLRVSSW